jgi:hypothetical protein
MDYHASYASDIRGIGKYDEAAIIYAYTAGRDRTVTPEFEGSPLYNTQERGYVEIFNNVGEARDWFLYFDDATNPIYTDLLEDLHYATLAEMVGTDGND